MLKHLVVPHHQYISPYESDRSSEKLVCPLCNKSDPAALITDYETNEIICCRCGNVVSEKNALANQWKLSNKDDDHEPAKYQLENVQINRQLSQQSNKLDNTLIVKTNFINMMTIVSVTLLSQYGLHHQNRQLLSFHGQL